MDSSKLPSASIFVNIIRGIIWAFAILAVLQPVFGIQPTAFVTALGVTSIALSFGLQDTISNLVGGLGLMLVGVVKPGDQVSIGNISGEVIDMNWRSTIVRDRGGKVDIIPNSVLNKTALVHRTRWDVTEVPVTIVLKPSADLDAVTQEIIETIPKLRGTAGARKPDRVTLRRPSGTAKACPPKPQPHNRKPRGTAGE